MAGNNFWGLDAATLTSLRDQFVICLFTIAQVGASWQVANRTYTKADLEEVKKTIGELSAAIDAASGNTSDFLYVDLSA